ncbi:MAG: hypothetical protein M3Z04_10310 [Chloroflexota bacterium]|nr:hypothetical protein [Chloroflexota bacterium]
MVRQLLHNLQLGGPETAEPYAPQPGDPPRQCELCGFTLAPDRPYLPTTDPLWGRHIDRRMCLDNLQGWMSLVFAELRATLPGGVAPLDMETADTPTRHWPQNPPAEPLLHRAQVAITLRFRATVADITPDSVRADLMRYANGADLVAPGRAWTAAWGRARAQRHLLHALLATPVARDAWIAHAAAYAVDVRVEPTWVRTLGELDPPAGERIFAPVAATLEPEDQRLLADGDEDWIDSTDQLRTSVTLTLEDHHYTVTTWPPEPAR